MRLNIVIFMIIIIIQDNIKHASKAASRGRVKRQEGEKFHFLFSRS